MLQILCQRLWSPIRLKQSWLNILNTATYPDNIVFIKKWTVLNKPPELSQASCVSQINSQMTRLEYC